MDEAIAQQTGRQLEPRPTPPPEPPAQSLIPKPNTPPTPPPLPTALHVAVFFGLTLPSPVLLLPDPNEKRSNLHMCYFPLLHQSIHPSIHPSLSLHDQVEWRRNDRRRKSAGNERQTRVSPPAGMANNATASLW